MDIITVIILFVALNAVALLYWFFSDSGLFTSLRKFLIYLAAFNILIILTVVVIKLVDTQ